MVVITIGFNDTPWNRVDDPCHAAPRYPVIEWSKITPECTTQVTHQFSAALGKVMSTSSALRGDKPLLLRVTTVYNNVIGDHNDPGWDAHAAVTPSVLGNAAFAVAQCAVARAHGGECAVMGPLMNGMGGRRDADRYLADHTHLNQAGDSSHCTGAGAAGLRLRTRRVAPPGPAPALAGRHHT